MIRISFIVSTILFFCLTSFASQTGNRFILSQLRVSGEQDAWDPYPFAARDILSFLKQTTSVRADLERNVVRLEDSELYKSPFLLYSGFGKVNFNAKDKESLKKYLTGGGFLFVEDRSGEKGGSFDYSFRNLIKELFPEKSLFIIPRDHAVYRSFYLLRTVGGRKLTNNYLEGIDIEGRTAIIYSQNDILGAWAKDLLGNYLFTCRPGGQPQRWESQKLMMNIILYSVTGTYKTDAIHVPFIRNKLRR